MIYYFVIFDTNDESNGYTHDWQVFLRFMIDRRKKFQYQFSPDDHHHPVSDYKAIGQMEYVDTHGGFLGCGLVQFDEDDYFYDYITKINPAVWFTYENYIHHTTDKDCVMDEICYTDSELYGRNIEGFPIYESSYNFYQSTGILHRISHLLTILKQQVIIICKMLVHSSAQLTPDQLQVIYDGFNTILEYIDIVDELGMTTVFDDNHPPLSETECYRQCLNSVINPLPFDDEPTSDFVRECMDWKFALRLQAAYEEKRKKKHDNVFLDHLDLVSNRGTKLCVDDKRAGISNFHIEDSSVDS